MRLAFNAKVPHPTLQLKMCRFANDPNRQEIVITLDLEGLGPVGT